MKFLGREFSLRMLVLFVLSELLFLAATVLLVIMFQEGVSLRLIIPALLMAASALLTLSILRRTKKAEE